MKNLKSIFLLCALITLNISNLHGLIEIVGIQNNSDYFVKLKIPGKTFNVFKGDYKKLYEDFTINNTTKLNITTPTTSYSISSYIWDFEKTSLKETVNFLIKSFQKQFKPFSMQQIFDYHTIYNFFIKVDNDMITFVDANTNS